MAKLPKEFKYVRLCVLACLLVRARSRACVYVCMNITESLCCSFRIFLELLLSCLLFKLQSQLFRTSSDRVWKVAGGTRFCELRIQKDV